MQEKGLNQRSDARKKYERTSFEREIEKLEYYLDLAHDDSRDYLRKVENIIGN